MSAICFNHLCIYTHLYSHSMKSHQDYRLPQQHCQSKSEPSEKSTGPTVMADVGAKAMGTNTLGTFAGTSLGFCSLAELEDV